jgi:two-component system, chemotaxis family, sensor kinase CheA
MSIDMAQFHQVFFEESFEGLDAMESGLLNFDMGDVDVDEINTIFRAAHSIKGGSGTFGFTAVSDFTHVMETLLDEMRDGRRKVTQSGVNVLLGSVDCLREMMLAIQRGEPVDQQTVNQHKAALDSVLAGNDAPIETGRMAMSQLAVPEANSGKNEMQEQIESWKISFSPHRHLLKTGNDPIRLFRELATLGEMSTVVDLQGVPDLYDLDPEECHLSWKLYLNGMIEATAIDEIFDWVEEDCDLSKQAVYSTSSFMESAGLARPSADSKTEPAKPILKAPTLKRRRLNRVSTKAPVPFGSTPAKSIP